MSENLMLQDEDIAEKVLASLYNQISEKDHPSLIHQFLDLKVDFVSFKHIITCINGMHSMYTIILGSDREPDLGLLRTVILKDIESILSHKNTIEKLKLSLQNYDFACAECFVDSKKFTSKLFKAIATVDVELVYLDLYIVASLRRLYLHLSGVQVVPEKELDELILWVKIKLSEMNDEQSKDLFDVANEFSKLHDVLFTISGFMINQDIEQIINQLQYVFKILQKNIKNKPVDDD